MITFFKKIKASYLEAKLPSGSFASKYNRGMTYVELIVVLSIFGIMSSIVMYNYVAFQDKIDLKNQASELALKIVEAQKSSINGKLTTSALSGWKPSYGVHFNTTTDPLKKQFIYFADLDNDKKYTYPEELETILMTKNSISGVTYAAGVSSTISSVSFRRPDSKAIFCCNQNGYEINDFQYVEITITSPRSSESKIKIFPSGRVQVD